jgi:hypothetical protein
MTKRLPSVRSAIAPIAALASCAFIASAHAQFNGLTTSFPDAARVAANAPPASRGGLFEDDSTTPQAPSPASRDSLFGAASPPRPEWHGFLRSELAYTYGDPEHWSKMLIRGELDTQGALSERVKYKLGARLDYDFVYDATNFYPFDVRRDQRVNVFVRENYLDIGAGDWDFRVGRQHIIWGEMVGLFFADVVSAKDLREFILPDFDILRIPQWAGRAEYFKGDLHAEAIWIPVPSYDEIGKPGAEFFPAPPAPPPGFATQFENEQFPDRTLAHSNYGLRLSQLTNGWDMSAFYYRSLDTQATFYRKIVLDPQPTFVYRARHDRIDQWGGTVAKDLGPAVFKAETVFTRGRGYNVLRLDDDDGVVRQKTLDIVGGLDFPLPEDGRLNLQLFDRVFFDHDPDIIPKRHEAGYSILLNGKPTDRLEAELLYIASLNRSDWLLRPRLIWNFQTNWRLVFGLDVFHGPPEGFFGQFANRDRVYTEVRYTF